MPICIKCDGKGIVSTGENKINLDEGRKEVCPDCAGSGITGEAEEVKFIEPKVGDACITVDEKPGTLQDDGSGKLVCVPNEENVV